ncbi:MAG: deoxyribodipyrimidine photo-lyase [Burkholderiaceae bacterium]|nr:deoxyribodipyrimidine photo-lyase [Microbacteriaceae bacterium]
MTEPAPESPTIVWFRDDLRAADHPALTAAVERGAPVIALFVLDDESDGIRPIGGASRWWLHHSLEALSEALAAIGGRLVLRRGAAAAVIADLITQTGAGAIVWNRRYGGAERAIDTEVKESSRAAGLDARSFAGSLLFEPWTITTGQGGPYSVFSPFWRACLASGEPRHPLPTPSALPSSPPTGPEVESDVLDDWGLLPTGPDWAQGLRDAWTPGEAGAISRLGTFVDEGLPLYSEHRDEPAVLATSNLSPHLRWGEVSPYTVWHALDEVRRMSPGAKNPAKFLAELGWREFSYHLLFHNPDMATKNFRPDFDRFPWAEPSEDTLHAWQRGRTGIPLVDAGMRQLWKTGYMHNRVRMVAASFLIKNLLVDWRVGEAWFWDTLVDADPASNSASWQWVAGSGADAAPYFRVFNPVLQETKFDPDREYIREFVPEVDGADYPEPIIDLGDSRKAALAAYEVVKRG